MGISTLSSAPSPPLLTSTAAADIVTTAGAVGVSSQAARSDHVHKYTHPDSGWLTPTLQNGWLVYDATFGNAAMYRKLGSIVFLRGLVKSGTAGAAIFTLPAGYRPSIRMLFSDDNATGHGRFDVATNGDVLHTSGGTGYFSIACSFPADG